MKFPNPTQPKNILENVPRLWTGSGLVRSRETQGFRLSHRSLTCSSHSGTVEYETYIAGQEESGYVSLVLVETEFIIFYRLNVTQL